MIKKIKMPKGRKLFKTNDEYKRFRESFINDVKDEMEEHDRKRLESIRASMSRIVNGDTQQSITAAWVEGITSGE